MTSPIKNKRRSASKRQAMQPVDPSDDSVLVEVPGYGVLTQRQKNFVERYREHGNGTRAAREAGYAGDNDDLSATASRLLRNPKVAWYLAFLGRNDVLQPGDVISRLRDLSVTADHAGAQVRATELAGKSIGMFREEVDITYARVPDDVLVDIIAGDDLALRASLMRKLTGGEPLDAQSAAEITKLPRPSGG